MARVLLRMSDADADPTDPDDLIEASETDEDGAGVRAASRDSAGARARFAASGQHLRAQLQGQFGVKPRAVPPKQGERRAFQVTGQTPPETPLIGPNSGNPFGFPPMAEQEGALVGGARGAGGKGGMMQPEDRARAQAALDSAPEVRPDHPFAERNATLSRQLKQLGIDPGAGDQRVVVLDLDAQHGTHVARTVGSGEGLVADGDIFLEAPDNAAAYREGQVAHAKEVRESAGENPSVKDLVAAELSGHPHAVDSIGRAVHAVTAEKVRDGVEGKVYLNMSYGLSPDRSATQIAGRMLMAPEGSELYEKAVEVLGHPPTRTEVKPGEFRLDRDEMALVKEKAIFPEMREQMKAPGYTEAMSAARGRLADQLKLSRQHGVMAFESSMNDYASAAAAKDPEMSRIVTSGVPGLFTVGATDPKGPGTADDTIAPFSADGHVVASHAGMAIPVREGEDGKAVDVQGTSFASPLMARTAYLVGAANPELSPDRIEAILTDPRVARDLSPGARRDGAGVVDDLAAVLVARDPTITAAQIEAARRQLDAHPDVQFTLVDGTLSPN